MRCPRPPDSWSFQNHRGPKRGTTRRCLEVAAQGVGGLGHLGIQFARRMGFRTVAIGRGGDKEKLAKDLGAHLYIDTAVEDAAARLQSMGGARAILATAPSGSAIGPLVTGLATRGKMIVVAVLLRDFPTVSYRFSRMGTVRTDIAGEKLCLRCRKHCNLLNRRAVEKPPKKIPSRHHSPTVRSTNFPQADSEGLRAFTLSVVIHPPIGRYGCNSELRKLLLLLLLFGARVGSRKCGAGLDDDAGSRLFR